jgi:hypothetical protein
MNREYQPLKLMPNQIYPTYQLHAQVANPNINPDDAMKLVILEVMAWLRLRFRALEMPDEIKLPEPDAYQSLDFSQIKSFEVDMGYILEVAFREEDRAWAMALREPDLGPRPEDTGNNRKPAPGRTFTTNIAVRIRDGKVDCGFRTVVSELTGETIPCEVFRLAVIKRLVNNPLLGLKQDKKFPISSTMHVIDDYTDLKALIRFLGEKQRQLPAVVFCRCPEGNFCGDPKEAFEQLAPAKLDSLLGALQPNSGAIKKALPIESNQFYDQMADTARHRMAYAYFFYLTGDLNKKFSEELDVTMKPGDCRYFVPPGTKGKDVYFPFSPETDDQKYTIKSIEDLTQDFLKGQDISFEGIWFLPEIHRKNKEDQLKQTMGQKSLEQIQKELRAENEAFRKKQMAEIRGDYAAEISRLEKDIDRLGKESERQEKASEKEKDAVAKQIRSMENTIQALSSEMEWLRIKTTMPKAPADVAAWVAKRYPDKLIFHDKAVALMKDVKPGEVDMELLCSALEFLAEEYRSMLTGALTEDEMNLCCERNIVDVLSWFTKMDCLWTPIPENIKLSIMSAQMARNMKAH